MSRLRAADLLTMAVMAAGVSAASAAALAVVQPPPPAATLIVLPRVEISVPRPGREPLSLGPASARCPSPHRGW